jgi:Leucine-rich repeat (LRR) protein
VLNPDQRPRWFGSSSGTHPRGASNSSTPQDLLVNDDEPWLRYREDAPKQEREFIPPTEESLKRTQEQVQAFNCGTVTDVPRIECEALVALYESTNGAGWTNNTNWLLTNTVGNWNGVVVSASHVAVLNLAYNQLTGTIPSELIQLSNLTVLDLHYNQLSGTIPSELGQLSKFEFLFLCDNRLTGTIPSELGQLSNLAGLYLHNNHLTGMIPKELGNLTNLLTLHLGSNHLTGTIPKELGNLTRVRMLNLHHNQLWGSMPSEIGNLTKLLHFDISHNYISGDVPASFANLVNLCVEGDLNAPCDGFAKTDLGYNLLNVPQPNPPSAFMYEKDPDWDKTQSDRGFYKYMPIIATK